MSRSVTVCPNSIFIYSFLFIDLFFLPQVVGDLWRERELCWRKHFLWVNVHACVRVCVCVCVCWQRSVHFLNYKNSDKTKLQSRETERKNNFSQLEQNECSLLGDGKKIWKNNDVNINGFFLCNGLVFLLHVYEREIMVYTDERRNWKLLKGENDIIKENARE